MTCDGSTSCPCESCRAKRHAAWEANDLIKPRKKEIASGHIPDEYAYIFRKEEQEILKAKLAINAAELQELKGKYAVNAAEIRILKDCAGV